MSPQDGNAYKGKSTDCMQCNPMEFCMLPGHLTRQRTYPRKRDCPSCKRAMGQDPYPLKKNMCHHHKIECKDPASCPGCMRKDACPECSMCEHRKKKRDCHECSNCPHDSLKTKCSTCKMMRAYS